MIDRHILLNHVARVQPTEEKVCLVFAAATVTTVEGPVKLPVAHHLAVHAQLETDALTGPNIPGENLVRSHLPGDHTHSRLYLFHSSRAVLNCLALIQ